MSTKAAKNTKVLKELKTPPAKKAPAKVKADKLESTRPPKAGAAFKMPAKLAHCVDLLWSTREARLKIQRECDELEKKEAAIKDHLINNIPKNDATGVTGKLCSVTIISKRKFSVKDWDKVNTWILKNKDLTVMNRKLSDAVVGEIYDNGKTIPGVEIFQAPSVSINKV